MAIIRLDQQERKVRIAETEVEHPLIFKYFDGLPEGKRDEEFRRALQIGVVAMMEDRFAAFLSRTENELGTQLEALALAHVGHQHQVALIRQALVDKGAPAAVITGHVVRDHLRIEHFSKSAVALTQQLIPGPELISAVALEAATTEVEIKVIGPVA